MEKILFVNACPREGSRTLELANYALSKLEGEVTQLPLFEENLLPLNDKTLALRDKMIAAMHEVRKVGACQGVLLTQKDLQESLAVVDSLAPDSKPSMRQDGLAHRKTEVDMFAGAVIRMADRFGMSVPVNEGIYQKVKEMEKTW